MKYPEPMVIRSRRHLQEAAVEAAAGLPMTNAGTTYTMAQVTSWVDQSHYAVGRWDGSLSIFEFSQSTSDGPKISLVVSSPASEGIQMIEWLCPNVIATSNDDSTVLIWKTASGTWDDLAVVQTLSYSASLGVANSADSYTANGLTYLVIGHANGYLTIWSGDASSPNFVMQGAPVDLTSPNPTNPYDLQNIRGVSVHVWNPNSGVGTVFTGSENGLICLVSIPSGQVLSKTVYNPSAQRGINAIQALGDNLIVANCSVGQADKNFWYYYLNNTTNIPELRSSFNLEVDTSRPQTFDFDVAWCMFSDNGQTAFGALASTEEGYLWLLKAVAGPGGQGNLMQIYGNQKITNPLGSALAVNYNGQLAVTSYDLYNFQLAQPSSNVPQHPRIDRLYVPESMKDSLCGIER